MRYRNQYWRFELDLPSGWDKPGFLRRLFSFGRYSQQGMHPEFYNSDGSSIKIVSGPISPVPSTEQQQRNLQIIALRNGHDVIEIDTINVDGKSHATMLCRVPGVGVLKNYSLIFGTTEYFITVQGNWQECDSIIKTFKLA